MTIANEIPSYQ